MNLQQIHTRKVMSIKSFFIVIIGAHPHKEKKKKKKKKKLSARHEDGERSDDIATVQGPLKLKISLGKSHDV